MDRYLISNTSLPKSLYVVGPSSTPILKADRRLSSVQESDIQEAIVHSKFKSPFVSVLESKHDAERRAAEVNEKYGGNWKVWKIDSKKIDTTVVADPGEKENERELLVLERIPEDAVVREKESLNRIEHGDSGEEVTDEEDEQDREKYEDYESVGSEATVYHDSMQDWENSDGDLGITGDDTKSKAAPELGRISRSARMDLSRGMAKSILKGKEKATAKAKTDNVPSKPYSPYYGDGPSEEEADATKIAGKEPNARDTYNALAETGRPAGFQLKTGPIPETNPTSRSQTGPGEASSSSAALPIGTTHSEREKQYVANDTIDQIVDERGKSYEGRTQPHYLIIWARDPRGECAPSWELEELVIEIEYKGAASALENWEKNKERWARNTNSRRSHVKEIIFGEQRGKTDYFLVKWTSDLRHGWLKGDDHRIKVEQKTEWEKKRQKFNVLNKERETD